MTRKRIDTPISDRLSEVERKLLSTPSMVPEKASRSGHMQHGDVNDHLDDGDEYSDDVWR